MLDALFNTLDLPGSSVRDVLAGENPFDQWASPFTDDHRTSGARLVSRYVGSNPNSLGTQIAGMGAEMLLDPTNLIGGAGILKRMIGARRAMQANSAADLAEAGRYAFSNPEALARSAARQAGRSAEEVVSPLSGGMKALPFYDDKMTLHHASPALWAAEPGFPYGRPNLKYMNTGEKNQAFGPGFYAAENPAVVDEGYMQTLAKEGYDPAKIEALLSAHEDAVNLVANALKDPRYAPMQGVVQDIIEATTGVTPVEGVYNVMKDSLFDEEVNPIISDLVSGFKGKYLIPQNVDDLQLSNSVLQDVLSNLSHEKELRRFGLSRGASLDDVNLFQDFAGNASKTVENLGDVEWDMQKNFQIIPPNRYTLSMPKEEWNRLLKSEGFMDDDPRTREIMDDVWLAISKASNGMSESQLDDIVTQFETATGSSALAWLREEIPGLQGKSGQPFPEYGNLKPGEFWDDETEKTIEMATAKLFDRNGVPGFKYWDGFSRATAGAADDTRNVVIWNQDLLDKIKPRIINGVAVPLDDMLPIQKMAKRIRPGSAPDDEFMVRSLQSPLQPRAAVPSWKAGAAALGAYNGARVTTHE